MALESSSMVGLEIPGPGPVLAEIAEIPPAGVQTATGGKRSVDNAVRTTAMRSPGYAEEALDDAERLLKYAAEMGVDVEPGVRDSILRARTSGPTPWNEKAVADLLFALTHLAGQLKPVSAASLKASDKSTRPTFRGYIIASMALAVSVVLFSTASFVATAMSKAISADIASANELAARIRVQLGAPPPGSLATNLVDSASSKDFSRPPPGINALDLVTELQQYAATIREIDARARQLNQFVIPHETDPFSDLRNKQEKIHQKFQLPVGLDNLWAAADSRTDVYQRVRSFAQSVLDNAAFSYGAFAACVLPVLYALLGACAYLLRNFEQQILTRTFLPSPADSARFVIAGIGGAVIGLFNFNLTQGASISPLAMAFLVGYAVDVFYSFLEGLLNSFAKKASS